MFLLKTKNMGVFWPEKLLDLWNKEYPDETMGVGDIRNHPGLGQGFIKSKSYGEPPESTTLLNEHRVGASLMTDTHSTLTDFR